VVEAQRIEIPSTMGRIIIGSFSQPKPGLGMRVFDTSGKERLGVGFGGNSGGVALFNASGSPVVGLSNDQHGTALTVSDSGKVRVALGVSGDGSSNLELYDAQKKLRAAIGFKGNSGGVALFNASGSPVAGLSNDQHGTALTVSDSGKVRVALGVSGDGSSNLELYDAQKKLRAAIGSTQLEYTQTGATENRTESSIVLFAKDGKVLWGQPPY
jgi:hypothetical protein